MSTSLAAVVLLDAQPRHAPNLFWLIKTFNGGGNNLSFPVCYCSKGHQPSLLFYSCRMEMEMETLAKVNHIGNGKSSTFPCAACKILRRRCGEKCVFAPYFPPHNPQKFTTAHRVFGASNIAKMLKDLPNDRRADAVSSMVYEANARVQDPVYGSAGTIHQLQHQISQLHSQLAAAQAEILKLRLQQANLLSFVSPFYSSGEESEPFSPTESEPQDHDKNAGHGKDLFSDESDPLMLWETLSI